MARGFPAGAARTGMPTSFSPSSEWSAWAALIAAFGLDESAHEAEGYLGDLLPAAVDGERMSAVWNLHDLCHIRVVLLALEGAVGECPRDGVVLFAGDDEH